MNGLRVVREEGQPITFVPSAIRNILRFVDIMPGAYLVGIVSVLVTRKNQRLGDLAAGTLVVRERRASDRPVADLPPLPVRPAEPAAYATLDASALTEDELAAIRGFLDRRFEIEPDARRELAQTLVERLAPKVHGAPAELRGESFLAAILAARGARSRG
jgi:hypothetical protein